MPDIYTTGNTPLAAVSLYYWDGSAFQKWTGSLVSKESDLYYWDGAAWQKWDATVTIANWPTQPVGASLGDGQLGTVSGDIYTVAAGYWTDITHLWLFNTGASAVWAYVNLKRSGGTGRRIANLYLLSYATAVLYIGPLSAGDQVSGYASAATTVNYEVLGVKHAL